MKTAISIDGGLLQQADEAARMMGLSRSRLFALAVADFLERQRWEKRLLPVRDPQTGILASWFKTIHGQCTGQRASEEKRGQPSQSERRECIPDPYGRQLGACGMYRQVSGAAAVRDGLRLLFEQPPL